MKDDKIIFDNDWNICWVEILCLSYNSKFKLVSVNKMYLIKCIKISSNWYGIHKVFRIV